MNPFPQPKSCLPERLLPSEQQMHKKDNDGIMKMLSGSMTWPKKPVKCWE